ncbi:MAG: SUMF1/EgtB/PvdO family nonheme iron enzyme [Desulfovibrionales bacterium]|nr:SUMF1/EgtB/PvdO family nonheme iron enzyme [Desulfovibrionales bacterium]
MVKQLNIRSDIYCEKDLLGFDKYVDTLSGMIEDTDFKTPFCIGIFGNWGSGKTSFMHLLENRLKEGEGSPRVIPVWFNPWRYEKEEHLIIPFLKTIQHEIEKYIKSQKGTKTRLAEGLKRAATKVGEVSAAIAYGIKPECKLGGFGIEFDIAKMADREEDLAKRRLEKARKISDKLSSIYYDSLTELKSAIDEKSFRLAVFVDDLDRCLPEKAVELFEAMKLFLDIEGCIFIVGVAKDIVKKGISYRYRFLESKEKEPGGAGISSEDYLDKMIQLPLELPPIEPGRKRMFIESLIGDAGGFREHADIIEIGVGDNPRSLKRFINLLAFTVRLAETVKASILEDRVDPKESDDHKELLWKYFIPLFYTKWTIIAFRFPKVHSDIKGNPERLVELQKAARGEAEKAAGLEESGEKKKPVEAIDDQLKRVLLKGEPFPADAWLMARFVHLTEATRVTAKEEASAGYSQRFEPGDMVWIPKGSFFYGDEKLGKNIEYEYVIDVFPVTNKQYKAFLDDEKEHEVPYIEEDWAQKYKWDKEKRSYPEGKGDHPVVLVSYQDALDFCRWRSQKEGKNHRLPTEEEWEKAARGIDGRVYPWGNEFNKAKCNTYESEIGGTTPVGKYPDSASPYGCRDMAGNVWEWTDSWYDEGQDAKVLRGGSWTRYGVDARCALRGRYFPGDRGLGTGFRCARDLE